MLTAQSALSQMLMIFEFNEGFEKETKKINKNNVSLEETETQYAKPYGRIHEEEKKLSINDSQSSIKSEEKKVIMRRDTHRFESDNFRANKSVRNSKKNGNFEKTVDDAMRAYSKKI